MPFHLFLARLVSKWYVALAAILGLLELVKESLQVFGFTIPAWAQIIPRWVFFLILLAAVVYGAYLVTLELFEEGRLRGREEIARLGELKLDIDEAATVAYSSRDGTSRYAVVHGVLRSSATSSVRVISVQLMDVNRREYQVTSTAGGIATTMGHIMLGDGFYRPDEILILEPNRSREVAMLFSAGGDGWPLAINRASFLIMVKNDHERSAQAKFSCRINR
jgi:hypothetical protein